jgi:hypothetical protein
MLTRQERELERQAQVVIQKELTPIQKLREDIKDLDSTLYVRVLALLVEAEGQEKEFLKKVYQKGLEQGEFTEFETFYRKFGRTK